MSLDRIHLRKLLQIAYAPTNLRTSLMRADIRSEIAKQGELGSGGGDFFAPFWSDAKSHAAQRCDLTLETARRVASNRGRSRLYPRLRDGFLTWWDDRRRWTNQELRSFETSAKGQLEFKDLGVVLKVENLLCVTVGENEHKLIYPYFSERPILTEEGARLGLWVMGRALPRWELADMRILDVMRGASYSVDRNPFDGREEVLLHDKIERLVVEWQHLWEEYY